MQRFLQCFLSSHLKRERDVTEPPKNKIYWTEGVTRKEVEQALSTNRYPALYRRSSRRALVSVYVSLVLLLVFSSLISQPKAESYITAIAGMLLLMIYFALRYSVRLIADAPSELLDERLIAIRERTYLIAYRWLSFVGGIVFGAAVAGESFFGADSWWSALLGLALLIAGLPSMVLAWTLPSEEP